MQAATTIEDKVKSSLFILFTFPKKEDYKELSQDVKKKVDMELQSICKGFLVTPEYKGGSTNTNNYKVCCEIVDYCSFLHKTWFYIICTAAGCILLNIISLVVVYMICRKKKSGGAEAVTPKTGKSMSKTSGANKGTPKSGKSVKIYEKKK